MGCTMKPTTALTRGLANGISKQSRKVGTLIFFFVECCILWCFKWDSSCCTSACNVLITWSQSNFSVCSLQWLVFIILHTGALKFQLAWDRYWAMTKLRRFRAARIMQKYWRRCALVFGVAWCAVYVVFCECYLSIMRQLFSIISLVLFGHHSGNLWNIIVQLLIVELHYSTDRVITLVKCFVLSPGLLNTSNCIRLSKWDSRLVSVWNICCSVVCIK